MIKLNEIVLNHDKIEVDKSQTRNFIEEKDIKIGDAIEIIDKIELSERPSHYTDFMATPIKSLSWKKSKIVALPTAQDKTYKVEGSAPITIDRIRIPDQTIKEVLEFTITGSISPTGLSVASIVDGDNRELTPEIIKNFLSKEGGKKRTRRRKPKRTRQRK